MQGELALAFGDLLRKLWAPGRGPVAPRPFKAKLARFAPQFSGCSQHDSQVSVQYKTFMSLVILVKESQNGAFLCRSSLPFC